MKRKVKFWKVKLRLSLLGSGYSAESLSEVVHSQKEYYILKWQYKNIPMLFIMIFETLNNLNLRYVKHL